MPKMVKEAYAIDKKNRNTLWQDAKQKEMENVKIPFQTTHNGEKPPKDSSMSIVIYFLTLKWRISIERHA